MNKQPLSFGALSDEAEECRCISFFLSRAAEDATSYCEETGYLSGSRLCFDNLCNKLAALRDNLDELAAQQENRQPMKKARGGDA